MQKTLCLLVLAFVFAFPEQWIYTAAAAINNNPSNTAGAEHDDSLSNWTEDVLTNGQKEGSGFHPDFLLPDDSFISPSSCLCDVNAEISSFFSRLPRTGGAKVSEGLFAAYPHTKHKVQFHLKYRYISEAELDERKLEKKSAEPDEKKPAESNKPPYIMAYGSAVYACEGSKMWLEDYDLNYTFYSTSVIMPLPPLAPHLVDYNEKPTKLFELTDHFHNFFFAFSEIKCSPKNKTDGGPGLSRFENLLFSLVQDNLYRTGFEFSRSIVVSVRAPFPLTV